MSTNDADDEKMQDGYRTEMPNYYSNIYFVMNPKKSATIKVTIACGAILT